MNGLFLCQHSSTVNFQGALVNSTIHLWHQLLFFKKKLKSMEKQKEGISGFTHKISLIYWSILMGPVLFGIIFYLLSRNLEQGVYLSGEMALAIIPIIAISCMFFGNFLFKKTISKIQNSMTLSEKLKNYRTAFIIRLSLVEGPAVVSTFIYYTTLNMIYLILAGLLILCMLSIAPKKEKIAVHLSLNREEKVKFNQWAWSKQWKAQSLIAYILPWYSFHLWRCSIVPLQKPTTIMLRQQ